TAKKEIIANAVLDEFAFPQDEFIVIVEKKIATSFEILDKMTVDYKQLIKPFEDNFAPIYEIDSYERSYYPVEIGGFRIDGRRIFKIIGTFESPRPFSVLFKLRDTGELTS
ncbi:MAG: hypothetical protein KAR20_17405, partial [Candidatus Heimdallarchaeota archaeon]|nr:hypothetical protein [Candidatus Heimdallarchaeota archaeon]